MVSETDMADVYGFVVKAESVIVQGKNGLLKGVAQKSLQLLSLKVCLLLETLLSSHTPKIPSYKLSVWIELVTKAAAFKVQSFLLANCSQAELMGLH